MVDPLGFRSVATHFLHRVAPGFTGRVRGRTWFPILCWGAEVIAERETERGFASDEEPRAIIRARRSSLANLERALRLGALLRNEIEDGPQWRYGNRVRWWELHRREELRTTYRDPNKPPFFSSRSSEIANNALGCLRRSLERHALFLPSENRFNGGRFEVLPSARYHLTDRGRELARAYEQDLRAQRFDLSGLKAWGLFPEQLGRGFKNDHDRDSTLRKLARALPVLPDGRFDRDRFPRSTARMDALFLDTRDPFFPTALDGGPIPATAQAFQTNPDVHPLDALAATPSDDPWAVRLRAANATLAVLMGRPREDVPPLFEILGRCFVEGMLAAFPDQALDCNRFASAHAQFVPDDLVDLFPKARDAYLRAWDNLCAAESQADMGFVPRVEDQHPTEAIEHFNHWLHATSALSLEAVLQLHLEMPRFRTGRVLPLVDLDAGGAYLDGAFPWGDVGPCIGDEDDDEDHDSDVSDHAEAVAEDEELEDDGLRSLVTDYWYTAKVARRVLLGKEAP